MRRALAVIGLVLVLLVGAAGIYAVHLVRAPMPQLAGTIEVAGLANAVTVLRDERGVPVIEADTLEDLFFAQGFVHAQDRFWEMDVRRHITAGRLSEMFGASQVPTDAFLRTLGWRRVAEAEVGMLSDRSRRILDAYAAGVNAYLADRDPAELSLEYSVLGLQNPDYRPEPWVAVDSVAWLKALAWDLRGNMTDEVFRAVMAGAVGVERTEQLFPPYPFAEHRPIVATGTVVDGTFDPEAAVVGGSTAGAPAAQAALPALRSVAVAAASLEPWLGRHGRGIGSNSWAVAGEHTVTGKPLLANDPHLAPSMPSLWYQSALRCRAQTEDCDYDVAGWTMAGLPGVFIGHNARIAWGFTNLGPDVTDLVLHQVDADGTYLLDGARVPLETREETIAVAGGDPVTITVRSAGGEPIISGIEGIGTYGTVGQVAPVPAPGSIATKETPPQRGSGYAVALRWTALEAQPTFDAFDALNTASDLASFRDAARLLAVPAQNLLYADTAGTIAYQAPGRIPVRANYDGKWPVPGWASRYRWEGFVPFEALPAVENPAEGFIVTANQAVIGPQYPYFLTDDWAYGTRSQRIVDVLAERIDAGEQLDAQAMRDLQMDGWNGLAAFMAPRLTSLPVSEELVPVRDLIVDWDLQQGTDSAGAAAFNALWRHMVLRMFDAAVPPGPDGEPVITADGGDRFWQVIERIWDTPDDFWWDDKTVPGTQSRDETLALALGAAATELRDVLGDDPASWRWGALHQLEFVNGTLGTSGIGPIEWLLNRGPIEAAGGESTVNATGWTPADGYGVTWVPSMRQVIDLADLDASTWVNLTGQSGHAFAPTYEDQIEAWRTGEQYPWPFTADAVGEATVDELTLVPAPA